MAIIAAVLIAGTTIWSIYQSNNENPGTELRKEVNRTQQTANNLDRSLTAVTPPSPPQTARRLPVNYIEETSRTAQRPGSNGVMPRLDLPVSGLDRIEGQPETEGLEATPNPYAKYENPADATAREAREFMAATAEELELQRTEYAAAVEVFYQEWEDRYEEAVAEHQRFSWRLEQANLAAAKYFELQAELTSRMPNAERRKHYQARDQEEMELFRNWQLQAYDILGQTNLIMDDLRQLHLELTKQSLSADFASLYGEFDEIPLAIRTLHQELETFRMRSEQLEERFGQTSDAVLTQ